jgi:hypothetical protein
MKYLDQYGVETENYYGYIYCIYDQKYKLVYIGKKKGKVEDSENYFGSGKIISNIIKSRGTYFLKKRILGVCYSEEENINCETECKLFYNSIDRRYGYNILLKDSRGDTFSYLSDEEKIIRRKNLSIACSGEKNGMHNKHHKQSSKNNIAKSKIGINFSHKKHSKIDINKIFYDYKYNSMTYKELSIKYNLNPQFIRHKFRMNFNNDELNSITKYDINLYFEIKKFRKEKFYEFRKYKNKGDNICV